MKSREPKSIERLNNKLALLLFVPQRDDALFLECFILSSEFFFFFFTALQRDALNRIVFFARLHPIRASSTTTGNTNLSNTYTTKYISKATEALNLDQ
jgi:hypothetical protein